MEHRRARSVARGVVAVVPESFVGSPGVGKGADRVLAGGPTRAGSVRRGLAAVPENADVVVVHDAARPLASRELFLAVVEAVLAGADGAIPGIVVADTINARSKTPMSSRPSTAANLWRCRRRKPFVPQPFGEHTPTQRRRPTMLLLEVLGLSVSVVPGEYHNLKLTSPEDLAIAERWRSR